MVRETHFRKEEKEGRFLGRRKAVRFCSVMQSGMFLIADSIHSELVMGRTEKIPHLSTSPWCY